MAYGNVNLQIALAKKPCQHLLNDISERIHPCFQMVDIGISFNRKIAEIWGIA